MNRKKHLLLVLLCLTVLFAKAGDVPSVMGLFPAAGSNRVVYNFSTGWRFHLGDVRDAWQKDFDDSLWQVVNCPHTLRLEPAEASGSRNYQGVAWYRKHFILPDDMQGREVLLHFEAIMGKQTFYVNGKKVKEHLGGYLPVTLNLSDLGLRPSEECLVSVMCDNSDDKTFPPGRKQAALDFCYHGGMYRDVWLVGLNTLHITDAVERGKVAGGGAFLHYGNISRKQADCFVDVEVANASGSKREAVVEVALSDKNGKLVKRLQKTVLLNAKGYQTAHLKTTLKNPLLWSPETPNLYNVTILVKEKGRTMDGGTVRMGIRKAEFRGRDGFYLNGEPYRQLIGGNRHQDFAYVGNAVPNSQQTRDAKRLKAAGMNIIRTAHYPQDPAFMDACDELGLFIIVATPGWQYWNKDTAFAQKVHQNTRSIIRRDRNHASVLMWEPILNETRYPKNFALEALQITREEFPFEGRPVAVADCNSEGVADNYDVLYDWTENVEKGLIKQDKCVFTREFGEMVDDWYAHNCLNRAARAWGEKPQLMAALSLMDTYGTMFHNQRQFIGGCQWHPFDHQRGYHPDTYFGGLYDAFRQKKYAFQAFRSQDNQQDPFVFIANEMTQFSDNDVVVFSSCDSVRLTRFEGGTVTTLPVKHNLFGIPNEPVVFKGAWNFWDARELSYKQRAWQRVSLKVEGIKGGKVVCQDKRMPSRRSTRIRLYVDDMGQDLVADGSDFVVVVAEVTDDSGNVKRLAREEIRFSVSGEGHIIGDGLDIGANPRLVEWGSAPILVQSTETAGKITITASSKYPGIYAPKADTLVIESRPTSLPVCALERATFDTSKDKTQGFQQQKPMSDDEIRRTLEEVNRQQADFGVQK